jgi:carbon monoxide dehydrogenase subunit G
LHCQAGGRGFLVHPFQRRQFPVRQLPDWLYTELNGIEDTRQWEVLMDFKGDVAIQAPREKVWAFLTDPNQVTQCAPGLQSVEIIDDDHFKCTVRAGVGMIKGTFVFDITWLERDEPDRARMQANGKMPGSAVSMVSSMDLSDDAEGGTAMHWESNVKVSGTIAGVGARLMGGVADRMTKDIFSCIKSKLEA